MARLLQLRRILLLALCVAAATEVDAKKHQCRPKPNHGSGGVDKGGNHHHYDGEIPRPVEFPQGNGGNGGHGHWNDGHGHGKELCCQWGGKYEGKGTYA